MSLSNEKFLKIKAPDADKSAQIEDNKLHKFKQMEKNLNKIFVNQTDKV